MSKTVCNPVSFSGKSGCDSGMRGKLNSFPSLQLPGEVHFGVEQNLHIKQCALEPGASCAEFRLAGDTPAQAGIQPRCEQPQGSVPAYLQHGRGRSARPWQTTDHQDKGSEAGRRQLEKGWLHLASGQEDQDPPQFQSFRGPALSPK